MQRQARRWWTFVVVVAIVRVVIVAIVRVVVVTVAVVGAGVVFVDIVAFVRVVNAPGPRRWGEILLA